MGKEKYLKNIEALFEKSPVVSYASIERSIKNKKKVKEYVKRFINYMLASGRIKRLSKGYYTKHDEASLAVFCFQPAYFGLQDALSKYNLWEQETVPVIITTRKLRTGIRKILGSNVLIRRIKRKYFFGIEYHQQGNIALPYSDIEKAFIDLIYFKEKINRYVISNLKKELDKKKLANYLKKYPVQIRKRVESYLA